MRLLSVVVPLFNQEQYIEKCIQSIQNQSLKDVEIIIVDDGSTDSSGEICDEFAKQDDRITVIHQENTGPAGARLSGIRSAKTKYITFVDADDFILENAYIRALEYMKKDIDLIFFEITRYYNENRQIREKHIFNEGFYDKDRIDKEVFDKLIWDFDKGTPGMECSQCVRITKRDLLLDRYNKLTVNVYYGEDMAITYPLYLVIDTMQVVSFSYYMHRQPLNQMCQRYISDDGYFKEVFDLYEYLISQFRDCGNHHFFIKQIEYLYMYIVQLKSRKYKYEDRNNGFLFPFDRVLPHSKVILYGAGNVGKTYFDQLNRLGYYDELLWVDKDAYYIRDKNVRTVDEIDGFKADFVVIAINDKETCREVACFLEEKGIEKKSIVY